MSLSLTILLLIIVIKGINQKIVSNYGKNYNIQSSFGLVISLVQLSFKSL